MSNLEDMQQKTLSFKYIIFLFFTFLFIWSLTSPLVFASNIIVSPSEMIFTGTESNTLQSEIIITNPADVEISYDFFVQNNAELVKVQPSSFTLDPDAKQYVTVLVDTKNSDKRHNDILILSKRTDNAPFFENETTYIAVNIEVETKKSNSNDTNMAGLYGLTNTNYTLFLIPFLIILNIILIIIRMIFTQHKERETVKKF